MKFVVVIIKKIKKASTRKKNRLILIVIARGKEFFRAFIRVIKDGSSSSQKIKKKYTG